MIGFLRRLLMIGCGFVMSQIALRYLWAQSGSALVSIVGSLLVLACFMVLGRTVQ